MNNILSILFSAFEFSSLLVLTLCAFRFKVTNNIANIALISVTMSIISFGFTLINMSSFYPIVQLLILIVLFKYVFKESYLYSLVSNVLGFVLFNVIELTLLALFTNYNLVDTSALGGAANSTTYIFQTISATAIFIVSLGMKYLNQGFGYVDVGHIVEKPIKTTNKYFVTTSVLTMTSLFVAFDLLLTNKNGLYIGISIGTVIILAIILIYLFNKRDNEQYK